MALPLTDFRSLLVQRGLCRGENHVYLTAGGRGVCSDPILGENSIWT